MARAREVLDKSLRALVLGLIAWATSGIVRALAAELEEPVRGQEHQALLDQLGGVLAPIETLIPAGAPLSYLEPLDSKGNPILADESFAFFQALLAPRRLEREGTGRYLLVHHRSPQGLKLVRGLEHARVLAELDAGLVLMERDGP